FVFFFSSRRRHTRSKRDWSSDVCSSDLPLQVEVELLQVQSHVSKNTSKEHMLQFYKTLDDVKDDKFDGMIVTGAPVEMLDFEEEIGRASCREGGWSAVWGGCVHEERRVV